MQFLNSCLYIYIKEEEEEEETKGWLPWWIWGGP